MRGQAHIVFAEQTAADLALAALQNFNIFSKNLEVQYAKQVSDETRLDGGTLDRSILDDRRRKRKHKADKKKLERREKLID